MPRPPVEYSPITDREYDLPDDDNVAFWVVPNVEHYDFENPRSLQEFTKAPPNVNTYSWKDYGNRVGVWRMMDILDDHGVRGTVALNSDICRFEPEIVEACVERDWELMGHGETNSRPMTDLTETEEREVVRRVRDRIEETAGERPRGWLGPARAETFNTPRILAEEGFEYVGDFVNDEQPYRMAVPDQELYSIPYQTEISDLGLMHRHHMTGEEFLQCVTDQFDVLYREGREAGNAKVMAISLHPYLIGLPFRSKYLDAALEYITGHDDVWVTTGGEIIDHYRENYE